MKYNFTYKNHSGVLVQPMWFGKAKLFVDGVEVAGNGKLWDLSDGTHIILKKDHLLFPKLVINEEEVHLIKLKKWEWVFVLLPGLLFFLGGALPAILAIGGVYICASIFKSQNINPALKIFLSIGYNFVAFFVILIVATWLGTVLK